jgi:3-methyladenine DNA glycosylase AlkC
MAFTQYSLKSSKKPIIIPISTQNGHGTNEPTIRGHVSLNPDDHKNGGIDMTLHFALKNKEKRSHSLPRHGPSKRYENNLKENVHKLSERRSKKETSRESTYSSSSRRPWSEVLGGADSPAYPSSYVQILQAERDDLQKYVERPTKSSSDKKFKKKTSESVCLGDVASEPDDVSKLSVLHPARTLQFLLGELQSIVKPKGNKIMNLKLQTSDLTNPNFSGNREQAVFKMIEDVISRLPNECSPEIQKQRHKMNTEATSKQQRSEVSLSKYELLRKERDELHMYNF